MTASSPRKPRHPGRHRRRDFVLDTFGLTRVATAALASRAATAVPALASRASQQSLGFVRTALAHRPELTGMRRVIAGFGAAAVLSLSLLGTPATGYAETPASADSAAAAAAEKPAPPKPKEPNKAPEKQLPEVNPPKKKEKPQPVAGLTTTQMNHAVKVVQIGQAKGISKKGQAVAVATAMQETKLKNLASHTVPESKGYDNDGAGSDHDSVGLFQQRPSMGWGSVAECMDVDYATKAFYGKLKHVSNWDDMSVAEAAQSVQASAFPDAYAQWEDLAYKVIDEVNK
ncbi:MAG: hypothetical protein ACRD0P_04325 [Stackebrandtia sp.]